MAVGNRRQDDAGCRMDADSESAFMNVPVSRSSVLYDE